MPRLAVVAAAQLGPAGDSRAHTVNRITQMIRDAGRYQVQLVVFPELALSSYFAGELHEDVSQFAEASFPSDETMPIVEAVREAGITVVLPLAEIAGDLIFNSSVVLGPDGSVLGRYRKSHIPGRVEPDPSGAFTSLEKRYFAPGDLGFPLFPSPAGPMGVGICYDRRFPELYRCYGLQGAGLVVCCFNTPVIESRGATVASAQDAQELATRGGAIANSIPVIAAGKAGVEGGIRYSGGSCVINHQGTIINKAETDYDELVIAKLDLDAAEEARERSDLEHNRRPELYGILTELSKSALAKSAELISV